MFKEQFLSLVHAADLFHFLGSQLKIPDIIIFTDTGRIGGLRNDGKL